MEFKGKWISNYQVGSWLIQDLETYQDGFKGSIAEVYYFDDGKDTAELNALLISKAPEMLEMLESIVNSFETDFVLDGEIVDSPYEWLKDRYKEAKQLIKESTEIN